MFSIIKNFFKLFVPSYKELLDLGYKASIKSGDFILVKNFSDFKLAIHQSVEPFNQKFEGLIDFEIYEACFIFTVKPEFKSLQNLESIFERVYPRGEFIFCFNKNLKFDMDEIVPLAKKIEEKFTRN